MVEEKVVQRDDDDPQREGSEVVEEEPVAQRKKEPKKTGKAKRKGSAKKSGEQGTDTDAGLRNKHLDRGSVIELLEKNALKAAFGPGNKDEMEDCYPILISFMRNLTDEQWQVIYKGFKKPMTKEQLAKLCNTIVDFIAQTTLQILLPALARILGVTGFYYNTDSLKRGGSARSFTAFEQKRLELIQEVKYLAKEMCNCGSRALRPRSSTPSSKSSQTSLKVHLGMPEDSIISSVQEQLSDHEILASCPPELTVGLIKQLFKKGNKKDSHRSESEQVQTTAEDGMLPSIVPHAAMSALPKDLPASSQQETPHKRPLLVRMFSAISKGLFKPFKQSLKTK
ncbi:uncharacterized protein LOC115164610 isoform X2 [Salmo trutta]|uniref:uncharacterized protein LOC115164610 isoform X2 n=1 Tax=Salmo trutta TaxID=8032 RepID=UPI0011316B60|nr:uncharacterized protein LOC115164610 isoform X2 [Salmo trutta]